MVTLLPPESLESFTSASSLRSSLPKNEQRSVLATVHTDVSVYRCADPLLRSKTQSSSPENEGGAAPTLTPTSSSSLQDCFMVFRFSSYMCCSVKLGARIQKQKTNESLTDHKQTASSVSTCSSNLSPAGRNIFSWATAELGPKQTGARMIDVKSHAV